MRSLLASIRDMASTLPSDAERGQAMAALDAVMDYLGQVRTLVADLPTSDSIVDLQAALDRLDALAEAADQNTLLRSALGTPPAPQRRKTAKAPAASVEDAERLLETLKDLTVDQIRDKLTLDDSVTVRDLRALAAHMSVRTSSRTSRQTLAQQLTSRIANQRGYKELGGGSHQTVEKSE